MSLRLSVLVPLIIASTVLAADLTEKWSKRLESADAAYQQALQKADNTRFYAVQKATQDRVKLLKTALTDATKSGDFEAATEIKSRLTEAELIAVEDPTNAVRGRPQFLAAVYGVNQSWNDVTDKMNAISVKRGGFPLIVTDEIFGDPAPQFTGGNTLVTRFILNGKIHTSAIYVGREFSLP